MGIPQPVNTQLRLSAWRSADTPVRTQSVFRFPQGIPGFEDLQAWTFSLNPDLHPFISMDSMPRTKISFYCVDPFLIQSDYAVDISDAEASIIGLADPADAGVLSLVTLSSDIQGITANLMCPLVINVRNLMGVQVVQDKREDLLRVSIWDAVSEAQLAAEVV